MSFFGLPRGRNKALSTIRIQLLNGGATNNANLYVDSAAPSVVTFYPGTWLELFASSGQTVNNVELFDSFGYTARIGTGAAASEVNLFQDLPGGNGFIPVLIAAGTRIVIQPIVTPVFDSTVAANDQPEVAINWYD
jgi:hypothetical protein